MINGTMEMMRAKDARLYEVRFRVNGTAANESSLELTYQIV